MTNNLFVVIDNNKITAMLIKLFCNKLLQIELSKNIKESDLQRIKLLSIFSSIIVLCIISFFSLMLGDYLLCMIPINTDSILTGFLCLEKSSNIYERAYIMILNYCSRIFFFFTMFMILSFALVILAVICAVIAIPFLLIYNLVNLVVKNIVISFHNMPPYAYVLENNDDNSNSDGDSYKNGKE